MSLGLGLGRQWCVLHLEQPQRRVRGSLCLSAAAAATAAAMCFLVLVTQEYCFLPPVRKRGSYSIMAIPAEAHLFDGCVKSCSHET